MKVIYNLKNILIQELQHCLESKLIEVMKMKMLLIQFLSSVTLIQIQLIQVAYVSCESQTEQLADASSER
jgi:hypothetical protein